MDEWIQREDIKHGVQLQTLIHRTIFKFIWVQWSLYVQYMYRNREQAVSIQLPTIWNIRWIIKYGTRIRRTTKKGKSKVKRVTKTYKFFCCEFSQPRSNLSCSKSGLLQVTWILTSDWITLRGSHAIHGSYVTSCKTSLPWAGKTHNMKNLWTYFVLKSTSRGISQERRSRL